MARIRYVPRLAALLGALLRLAAQESPGSGSSPDPGYRLLRDLPYRSTAPATPHEAERCRLDLYCPTGTAPFATVVWFHGGGLTGGARSIPAGLRRQGLAVVAAGYRLSPHVQSPTHLQDAAAAVAWTFRHVAGHGGDTNRIFVAGHSAGGYLTLLLGLDRRWLGEHQLDPDRLAGLVPLSPQVITHFTIRKERGIPDTQPVIDSLAPLYHVRSNAPPILLVTGDREKELLGRYEENAYFWRMLRVVGHPAVELVELKGFDHGGMAEPALPRLVEFVRTHRR